MAKWIFEPGHTAAEFSARHMMVTYVRGHFKNVRGSLIFDPANPSNACVEVTIDAAGVWTGEADRDAHLRSADFLDVGHHSTITFKGDQVDQGPKTRAGFTATTTIDRRDYGVSWNASLDRGGAVVGNTVEITIDAEAILKEA